MAETLGILCDKLTIVKLKQFHTEEPERLQSLNHQAIQLQEEIDDFLNAALNGDIPVAKLTFAANKVFKNQGNQTKATSANIGNIFSQLADINCQLWHEVEKGYDIENVPQAAKDNLVKTLAILNLERNKCIDKIDAVFQEMIIKQPIHK